MMMAMEYVYVYCSIMYLPSLGLTLVLLFFNDIEGDMHGMGVTHTHAMLLITQLLLFSCYL